MVQISQVVTRDTTDQINIKLDAYQDTQKSTPLLSELGVLATAINRALNDAATPFIEQSNRGKYHISRASHEPNLVQASITGVQNGSVIIEVYVAATDYVKANDTSIITGLIASMAWDGVKVIGKHFARAAARLGGSVISHQIKHDHNRIDPDFDAGFPSEISQEPPINHQLSDLRNKGEFTHEPLAMRTINITITVREITHYVQIEYDANSHFTTYRE